VYLNSYSRDLKVKLFFHSQLKDDPQRRKFKTAIKWRNLNPEFCEFFTFETKMGDMSRRALLLSVWDKDIGKSDDYLGMFVIGCLILRCLSDG